MLHHLQGKAWRWHAKRLPAHIADAIG